MYQQNEALDYNFDMFEEHVRNSGAAAAPAKKSAQKPERKPQLRLVENKNAQPVRKDEKHTGFRSAIIFLFAVMVLGCLGLQIHSGARSYELSQQISALENKISEAETENVRLTNTLNSITTIENIDNYARNVLGMTKSESYQIKCIDLSEGDKVLYSGSSFDFLNIFDKN